MSVVFDILLSLPEKLNFREMEALARSFNDTIAGQKTIIGLHAIEQRLNSILEKSAIANNPSLLKRGLFETLAQIMAISESTLKEVEAISADYLSKQYAADIFEYIKTEVALVESALTKELKPEQVKQQDNEIAAKERAYAKNIRLLTQELHFVAKEEKELFNELLQNIANIPGRRVIKQCFISYVWPRPGSAEEGFLQPFLRNVQMHLKLAGIATTRLDVEDAQAGESIYRYMEQIKACDFILLIGTESLMDKHLNQVSAFHTELIHIMRKRKEHAAANQPCVIPINLSMDFRAAFPAGFEMYTHIVDWLERDYLISLKNLIRQLYGIGNEHQKYHELWDEFVARISAKTGYLLRESPQDKKLPLLPEVSLVELPNAINYSYISRAALEQQIDQKLFAEEARGVAALIACHGMGGVGKTELAKYYRRSYGQKFKATYWFNAEKFETLSNQYQELAKALGVGFQLLDLQVIAQVKNWFERQEGPCLLIFDNAENQESLAPFLPTSGQHKILVTSRNIHWPQQSKIEVSTMNVVEARALVRQITGIGVEQEDDAIIDQLVHVRLGCLPLAIAQASAYITNHGISIAKYIEIYELRWKDLLYTEASPAGLLESSKSVWITWDVSLSAVEEAERLELLKVNSQIKAPLSRWILEQISLLSAEKIPCEFLYQLYGLKENMGPEMKQDIERAVDFALMLLRRYSMIQKFNDAVQVYHRLIQQVVAAKIPTDSIVGRLELNLAALEQLFHFNMDTALLEDESLKFVPHVLVALQEAEKMGLQSSVTASLQLILGEYFGSEKRDVQQAMFFLQKAGASIAEYQRGEWAIALGFMYCFLEMFDVAEQLANMAYFLLQGRTDIRGRGMVFWTFALRGHIAYGRGNFALAKPYYLETVKLGDDPELKEAYPITSMSSCYVMGLGHALDGDFTEAKRFFNQVIDAYDTRKIRANNNIINAICALAGVLCQQGALSEAEAMTHRGGRLCEEIFEQGPHPFKILILQELAYIMILQERTDEAEYLFQQIKSMGLALGVVAFTWYDALPIQQLKEYIQAQHPLKIDAINALERVYLWPLMPTPEQMQKLLASVCPDAAVKVSAVTAQLQ